MCAFRWLASLLLLVPVVKAARPSLELMRQAALVAQDDPCERFDAKKYRTGRATGEVLCHCFVNMVANSQCSRPGQHVFSAAGNGAGCGCQGPEAWAKSVKSPVETAALAFCEAAALVGDEDSVPSVSVCEEQLSNRKATGPYGRLDAWLAEAPKTAVWHLRRVCRDECKELVKKTQEDLWRIQTDMNGQWGRVQPVGETCAARVVKQVEAEIFGCCGRSCGWNGRSCISWPFFDEQQKADWQAECCTEYNASISVDSEHNEAYLFASAFCKRKKSHSKSNCCRREVTKLIKQRDAI